MSVYVYSRFTTRRWCGVSWKKKSCIDHAAVLGVVRRAVGVNDENTRVEDDRAVVGAGERRRCCVDPPSELVRGVPRGRSASQRTLDSAQTMASVLTTSYSPSSLVRSSVRSRSRCSARCWVSRSPAPERWRTPADTGGRERASRHSSRLAWTRQQDVAREIPQGSVESSSSMKGEFGPSDYSPTPDSGTRRRSNTRPRGGRHDVDLLGDRPRIPSSTSPRDDVCPESLAGRRARYRGIRPCVETNPEVFEQPVA